MGQEQQTLSGDDSLDAAPETEVFSEPTSLDQGASPAGMFRRMAALFYDGLALSAVLMVATVPFLPFLHGKVLVPEEVGVWAYVYRAWELLLAALFFGFFWTRRGQTLGMQAWRLRVQDHKGHLLGWGRALLREAYAVLPWLPGFLLLSYSDVSQKAWAQRLGEGLLLLGVFAWTMMWLDPRRRTWHDRLSRTRVVIVPKRMVEKGW